MNIFSRLLFRQNDLETRLGNPLRKRSGAPDEAAIERRMNNMRTMARGKGFSQEPAEPRKDAQGRTRGDRKRALRAYAREREHDRQKAEAEKILASPFCAATPEQVCARFGSLAGDRNG